jgi:hypothetical protein
MVKNPPNSDVTAHVEELLIKYTQILLHALTLSNPPTRIEEEEIANTYRKQLAAEIATECGIEVNPSHIHWQKGHFRIIDIFW